MPIFRVNSVRELREREEAIVSVKPFCCRMASVSTTPGNASGWMVFRFSLKILLYVSAHRGINSSYMSGNSFLKHPANGSPIVAAHSSSLRLGKCNSAMVICMVVTIFRLVSPSVPSKSKIISPLFIFTYPHRNCNQLKIRYLH